MLQFVLIIILFDHGGLGVLANLIFFFLVCFRTTIISALLVGFNDLDRYLVSSLVNSLLQILDLFSKLIAHDDTLSGYSIALTYTQSLFFQCVIRITLYLLLLAGIEETQRHRNLRILIIFNLRNLHFNSILSYKYFL